MSFLHSVSPALLPAHGVMANAQPLALGCGEGSLAQPRGGLSGDQATAGRERAATAPILPGFPCGPRCSAHAASSGCPSSPASRELISAGQRAQGKQGPLTAWGEANCAPAAVCLPEDFLGPFPLEVAAPQPPRSCPGPRCAGRHGLCRLQQDTGSSAMAKPQHSHPLACLDAHTALLTAARTLCHLRDHLITPQAAKQSLLNPGDVAEQSPGARLQWVPCCQASHTLIPASLLRNRTGAAGRWGLHWGVGGSVASQHQFNVVVILNRGRC